MNFRTEKEALMSEYKDITVESEDNGGKIVFAGTPRDLARCPISKTGQWLHKTLL